MCWKSEQTFELLKIRYSHKWVQCPNCFAGSSCAIVEGPTITGAYHVKSRMAMYYSNCFTFLALIILSLKMPGMASGVRSSTQHAVLVGDCRYWMLFEKCTSIEYLESGLCCHQTLSLESSWPEAWYAMTDPLGSHVYVCLLVLASMNNIVWETLVCLSIKPRTIETSTELFSCCSTH